MPVRTEAPPSAARDETTEQPPIGKPRVHLDADDKPGGCAVGQRSERYHLRALVSFTQSLLPHATDGSGHLVLHFRVPTQPCEKASGGDVVSEAARLLVKAAIDNVLKVVKEGLPVSKVEVGDGATSAPATAAASAGRLVPCFRPEDVVKHWDDPGQWFVWNDFALQPSTDAEVRKAHSEWKRPCLVVYSVDGLAERVEHLAHTVTPSAGKAAYLSQEFSLMHQPPVPLEGYAPTFTALSPGESTLQRGALVAIDAEFVAVTREVTRVGARGKTIVVKPARLALARVSCLRGDGPMAGVPFIDSYVQQAEPVVDYLTRFSGLVPGDLDPSVTRHYIETMKAAYLKLRQLVDAGAVFVGHGLKTDFEVINLVVPSSQIIDTVNLFWIEGQRRISLRFLAWHLCGIQMSNRLQDTHDSIEDARTALVLYQKYLELQAEGVFEQALEDMYDVGRDLNWEVPT